MSEFKSFYKKVSDDNFQTITMQNNKVLSET